MPKWGNANYTRHRPQDLLIVKMARDTLRMLDEMAGVMSGMTKEQASQILKEYGLDSSGRAAADLPLSVTLPGGGQLSGVRPRARLLKRERDVEP